MKKYITTCNRIKLKPDSADRVMEWAKFINERKDEALQTLEDEGVFIESVFLEKTPEADYLIYYMKLESLEKAGEVVSKSKHAIDAYHKQFKIDCWEKGESLQLLVDLQTEV